RRGMRSKADRGNTPQLAVPPRPSHRCLRADPQSLHRMTDVRPAATSRAGESSSSLQRRYVMPAEWERHDATWIAWPHHEPDWPGKLGAIPWVYAEIVRALHTHERVEILCNDEIVRDAAHAMLTAHDVAPNGYRLHIVPTDRVWLRDSAPTFVWKDDGSVELMSWRFNAWAKYDNYRL